MKGNQHAQFAIGALEIADKLVADGSIYARDGAMLAINAQSTLALAFEQRTANLIAFEQGQWAAFQNGDLSPEGQELWKRTAEQIVERLEL
jgi:hypothetical protein